MFFNLISDGGGLNQPTFLSKWKLGLPYNIALDSWKFLLFAVKFF